MHTRAMVVALALLTLGTPTTATLMIRGKAQTLHLYGARGAPPVVVASGDGGWVHLGPYVADTLAAKGYFVVGFDAKAYLASFTEGSRTLTEEDVPRDYRVVVDFAARDAGEKPILIGVSEGAGLSVLAAGGPDVKPAIAGVIGLGLPDVNELGWRWRDMIIYVTKGVPKEPTFSAGSIASRVAPLPLAAIHSTRDEFVPLGVVQRVMDRAGEPKKLWIVPASDHRFSDNLGEFDARLLEAIAWVRQNQPK